MRLELLSIDFRRPYAGLGLRLDPGRPAPRPEWPGLTEATPVLLGRRSGPLEIEALVRLEGPAARELVLRAEPGEGSSLLGVGASAPTTLRPGVPEVLRLRFPEHALDGVAVGRRALELVWRARSSEGVAVPLAPRRSQHEVFTVLAEPHQPWDADERAFDAPWVSALAFAARWAEGAESELEAAAAITRAIWRLGLEGDPAERFLYDVDGVRGYIHRAGGRSFPLARFLDRAGWLRDGAQGPEPDPGGGYVECRDLATALCVLANLVGCELLIGQIDSQIQRLDRGFFLRPFRLFGGLDQLEGFYDFHEIAYKDGLVFDACLALPALSEEGAESGPSAGVPLRDYLAALVDRGRSDRAVDLARTLTRELHQPEELRRPLLFGEQPMGADRPGLLVNREFGVDRRGPRLRCPNRPRRAPAPRAEGRPLFG